MGEREYDNHAAKPAGTLVREVYPASRGGGAGGRSVRGGVSFVHNVMISASFTVGKEDAMALTSEYYVHSPTIRRARFWGRLGVPVLMGGLALLIFCQSSADKTAALPLLGWGLIWTLFFPRYYAWRLMRTAEKMFQESSYHKTFGSYSLTLNEDGILSSSPVGEGRYAWSAVTRVLLTAEHLLVFLSGPQGYAVPRKQLPDATIQEMKAFIEERMTKGEPTASHSGGPATPVGNSGVADGRPSVS